MPLPWLEDVKILYQLREKRYLEHVKKLILLISALSIFNDLHCG